MRVTISRTVHVLNTYVPIIFQSLKCFLLKIHLVLGPKIVLKRVFLRIRIVILINIIVS